MVSIEFAIQRCEGDLAYFEGVFEIALLKL
jgi:hypothetical protein